MTHWMRLSTWIKKCRVAPPSGIHKSKQFNQAKPDWCPAKVKQKLNGYCRTEARAHVFAQWHKLLALQILSPMAQLSGMTQPRLYLSMSHSGGFLIWRYCSKHGNTGYYGMHFHIEYENKSFSEATCILSLSPAKNPFTTTSDDPLYLPIPSQPTEWGSVLLEIEHLS